MIGRSKVAVVLTEGNPTTQSRLDMNWKNRIVCDPQILGGKPCLVGTRIPAALVLGYLAVGTSNHEIVQQFPGLEVDDVLACLGFARDLAESNSTFS